MREAMLRPMFLSNFILTSLAARQWTHGHLSMKLRIHMIVMCFFGMLARAFVVASHHSFRFHVFPLPYHQQAFLLSKAAETVDYLGDSKSSVFTYMDTVFANQDQIYTSSTADMTYNQVVDLIMPWATNGKHLTSICI